VAITVDADAVEIIIDDDGSGLPAGARRSSGTKNLAKRATSRGGTMELTARASGGTRLLWTSPLAQQEASK
jgi:hypothetical protein